MGQFDTAADAWSQTFARRLLELQPQLDLADAIRACIEVLPSAADLDAEQAAEIFHFWNPPGSHRGSTP
jgi:hypothetical protein